MNLGKHGLRAFGLCFMAALGLMAFSAVSAQAVGEFYVLELPPAVEKLLSFKEHGMTSEPIEGRIDELGKLLVSSLGIAIGCDELHLVGATASVGGFLLGKILYLKCVVLDLEGKTLAKCAAQDAVSKVSGDITTELILGTVFLHPEPSGETYILFTPDAKLNGLFADIEITGAECAASGLYPVEGSTIALVKPGDALWLLIKAITDEKLFPNDKLKFGERKASLDGSVEIKLGEKAKLADKDWSAL